MGKDSEFSFAQLDALLGQRHRKYVVCPICSEFRKPIHRRHKCMALAATKGNRGEYAILYYCHNCETKGIAFVGDTVIVPKCEKRIVEDDQSRNELAKWLWSISKPLDGSLAAVYLKSRKCFVSSSALRFLPARAHYPPAMIAKFDGCDGIHLTKLRLDGCGKADCEKPKIMIGPSNHHPIIIQSPNGVRKLFITEGIEDAASIAIALGDEVVVWAAGSASRISHLIKLTRDFDKVYVDVDDDDAGHKSLHKARKIRRDIVPVNFTHALQSDVKQDANSVLIERGVVMVQACIDWCDRAWPTQRVTVKRCA